MEGTLLMSAGDLLFKVTDLTVEAKTSLETIRDSIRNLRFSMTAHLVWVAELEKKLNKVTGNKRRDLLPDCQGQPEFIFFPGESPATQNPKRRGGETEIGVRTLLRGWSPG